MEALIKLQQDLKNSSNHPNHESLPKEFKEPEVQQKNSEVEEKKTEVQQKEHEVEKKEPEIQEKEHEIQEIQQSAKETNSESHSINKEGNQINEGLPENKGKEQNPEDPLMNINPDETLEIKREDSKKKGSSNAPKKLGIFPEKEPLIEKKFKSFFQSPTLNRAFGDFMHINIKTLRDEKTPTTTEEVHECEIKPFVMGICGGTSAGKSQIVKMIVRSLNKRKNIEKVTFLSEENFFKSKSQHNQEESEIDFDHPNNIDWEMFKKALNALLDRKKFEIPLFDMKSENRKKETKLLEPADLIIVEGRLVFYDENIRAKCDLKIFLDTDEDIRLSRRVYKDVLVRKKDVGDVIDRYLKHIKPDFEKFVLPSKKYADIIIPNYGGGFSNEVPEDGGVDEIGFDHFDHAAVGLIIDQVYKKVKKIKEIRTNIK